MQVLHDLQSVALISDPALRAILDQCLSNLGDAIEGDFSELLRIVVVEPGDLIETINRQIGISILSSRHDGTRFGDPGFQPLFEILEEHPGYYEIVFVLSDDGYGVEVFVKNETGVDPDLLAMCSRYAVLARRP